MQLTRRELLAAAAGAAAPWRMRLSASSVLFNTLPVEQACARIADAGYEAVDYWQGERFKTNHLEEALARLGPDGLARLLVDHRLRLCSFTCFFIGIDRYADMLGAAGRGDGAFIRESRYYGTAPNNSGGATRPTDLADLRRQMRDLVESLKPQLALAGKHNFRVAIENHSNAILNSVDSFKVFLDLATHPRLWIALAPYHLQRDRIPVEDVIALAGHRTLFFYAWQNEPGNNQLPGVGSTDFTPWIRALAKVNYRGYVNPFMHDNRHEIAPDQMSPAIVRARRYLEQCRETIEKQEPL